MRTASKGRLGRPRQYKSAMSKTSMALPQELVEALKEAARISGFKSWAEQARFELMQSRGMWRAITPTLPGSLPPTQEPSPRKSARPE